MDSRIREAFEELCHPYLTSKYSLDRHPSGEYISPVIQDHWNDFKQGWESAAQALGEPRKDSMYSDIVSDGGMDPRN